MQFLGACGGVSYVITIDKAGAVLLRRLEDHSSHLLLQVDKPFELPNSLLMAGSWRLRLGLMLPFLILPTATAGILPASTAGSSLSIFLLMAPL